MSKIWQMIKEDEELSLYFPNYRGNKLSDREFLWNILFTLRPNETSQLIIEARGNRSVEKAASSDDLVEIASDFYELLKKLKPQKSKFQNLIIWILIQNLKDIRKYCFSTQEICKTDETKKATKAVSGKPTIIYHKISKSVTESAK